MTCLQMLNDLYHTKNQSDMEIRIYEKTELALLYFPRSEAKVALNRLKRWIKNNPELSEALDDCKVGKFAKYYSRHQVELIVDYLDEP